jgi:hypothetical protein
MYQSLLISFPHNVDSDSFLKRLLARIWFHKRENAEEVGDMICAIEGIMLIWLSLISTTVVTCIAVLRWKQN